MVSLGWQVRGSCLVLGPEAWSLTPQPVPPEHVYIISK